jgi:hypothetical protein
MTTALLFYYGHSKEAAAEGARDPNVSSLTHPARDVSNA